MKFPWNRKRTISVALTVLGVLSGIYFSGVLVSSNFLNQSNLKEVEDYDVLAWQHAQESLILEDYYQQEHILSVPYLIVDPYQMNPLSALVIFNAKDASTYTISIKGHNEIATISYAIDRESGRVELPILGLYPGEANEVAIESEQGLKVLSIETDELPWDFQHYQLIQSSQIEMEPGLTLMIACFDHSYSALLDSNGEVRGYFSNTDMMHGNNVLQLENGHWLVSGDEYKQIPYNMTSLWEINPMGKIFQEYEIPNGVHHDMFEMSNGDILIASNQADFFNTGTREDVVSILDRNSGEIKQTIDFRQILDEKRDPYHHFHPDILNPLNVDWMHMNGVLYEPLTNSLIVSSPTQSQVVAIDYTTHEIQWILGSSDGYEDSKFLKPYLLQPIGDNFEWSWGQHHPSILPDQDRNPETLDLLVFDNGQNRNFSKANAVLPADNYSRAVQYRIHLKDKTVEQLWSYGKERGSTDYSTFLGDAEELPLTGNRLITFGGQIRSDGIAVDEIFQGVLGTAQIESRIVEVNENDQVVFEVKVTPQNGDVSAETYQSQRVQLFSQEAFMGSLGDTVAQRSGDYIYNDQVKDIQVPNLFFGDFDVDFNRLDKENHRLIVDGNLSFKGKHYLLSQAYIVLKNYSHQVIYKANSGLNGRFFANIDLRQLEPGMYRINIVGGVKEGNDVLSGKLNKGYIPTEYTLTIH